jgi:hypothetical protein
MNDEQLLCPSAQPDQPEARVFGVQMTTTENKRRVGYLTQTLPVTNDILALSGEAQAPEVLRIAAPCMGGRCLHYDGGACSLAGRVAQMLDPVVGTLPRCAIRPTCRWFREQGPSACVRCPQVVTNGREGDGVPIEVAYQGGVIPNSPHEPARRSDAATPVNEKSHAAAGGKPAPKRRQPRVPAVTCRKMLMPADARPRQNPHA